MGRQFRHGDVLIEQLERLPGSLHRLEHGILAQGEVTGHSHRLEPAAGGRLFMGPGGRLYMEVVAPVRVVHQEHAPIHLDPGFYRVWRQREYSPQEIRVVRD